MGQVPLARLPQNVPGLGRPPAAAAGKRRAARQSSDSLDDDADALDAAILTASVGSQAPAGPAVVGAGDGADREARWQQVCCGAGDEHEAPDAAETVGPGWRTREHRLQIRVDRASPVKLCWLAAELVLQGRCADTGVPYAPPSDAETANGQRHRQVRLRRAVPAAHTCAQRQ